MLVHQRVLYGICLEYSWGMIGYQSIYVEYMMHIIYGEYIIILNEEIRNIHLYIFILYTTIFHLPFFMIYSHISG